MTASLTMSWLSRRTIARSIVLGTLILASACAAARRPPDWSRVEAISEFGDLWGWNHIHGKVPRDNVHGGVDYKDDEGAPVLAAAEGTVAGLFENHRCGQGITLSHWPHGYYTIYCHLREWKVGYGEVVRRGTVIGAVGATGFSGGVPHLHFELWERPPYMRTGFALPEGIRDPHERVVGCFKTEFTYPTDRFVLTYPVRCR